MERASFRFHSYQLGLLDCVGRKIRSGHWGRLWWRRRCSRRRPRKIWPRRTLGPRIWRQARVCSLKTAAPRPRLDRRAPRCRDALPLRTAATVTQISKPIAGASSTRNRRDSNYRSAGWLRDRETRSWRLSAPCTRVPYGSRHRALGQRCGGFFPVWRSYDHPNTPRLFRSSLARLRHASSCGYRPR